VVVLLQVEAEASLVEAAGLHDDEACRAPDTLGDAMLQSELLLPTAVLAISDAFLLTDTGWRVGGGLPAEGAAEVTTSGETKCVTREEGEAAGTAAAPLPLSCC
jgi:hypothetical protein